MEVKKDWFLFFAIIWMKPRNANTAAYQNWFQLPGTAIQISAKGNELWALTKYNQPKRWTGTDWAAPCTNTKIDRIECLPYQTGTMIAASSDGNAWLINANLPTTVPNIFQYNSVLNQWDKAQEGYAYTINGDSGVHVSWSGQTYQHVGNGWTMVDSEHKNLQAAVGDNAIYAIDVNNKLRLLRNAWIERKLPDGLVLTYVDVQSGDRVVVTDSNYNVWVWQGSAWRKLDGPSCVQATINYKSVFCIDDAGAIYRTDL